jgi:hypothetical protein
MTPKQIALVKTAKITAIGITVAFIINIVFWYFTATQLVAALVVAIALFAIKSIYDLERDKAEREQQNPIKPGKVDNKSEL